MAELKINFLYLFTGSKRLESSDLGTVGVFRVPQMRGAGYADVRFCTSNARQQSRCGTLKTLTIYLFNKDM